MHRSKIAKMVASSSLAGLLVMSFGLARADIGDVTSRPGSIGTFPIGSGKVMLVVCFKFTVPTTGGQVASFTGGQVRIEITTTDGTRLAGTSEAEDFPPPDKDGASPVHVICDSFTVSGLALGGTASITLAPGDPPANCRFRTNTGDEADAERNDSSVPVP